MSQITKRALEQSLKNLLRENRFPKSLSLISPRTAASAA